MIENGGASEAELMWFVENRCAPDIIGVNHYITSERYLSDDLDPYPACYHGGNGRHCYADVEAARCLTRTGGIRTLLEETWARYRLPLAITEVHIDTTREDQLRWIVEVWRAAESLKASGADMRAVTLWALFGTFDWNCLVAECRGYYEPGAFDVRATPPRATAIAELAKSLSGGIVPDHPVLAAPGWWKRSLRFYGEPVEPSDVPPAQVSDGERHAAPVLITGATGTLGRAFARICEQRGLAYRLLNRQELDIADPVSVEQALARYSPWAVVNTAGYVRVDDAEHDAELCYRENTRGPETLAALCARDAVGLVTFSTDLVFDGTRGEPYVETDAPAPLNVYGRTKAEAERRVLERYPEALVVRTSAFFGPWDEHNYVALVLRALRSSRTFRAANDQVISPTYVPDLVNVTLDLLIDRASGIWHASNGEALSWAGFALRAAQVGGVSAESLVPCTSAELELRAKRPAYSALSSGRCTLMPTLSDALARFALQWSTP